MQWCHISDQRWTMSICNVLILLLLIAGVAGGVAGGAYVLIMSSGKHVSFVSCKLVLDFVLTSGKHSWKCHLCLGPTFLPAIKYC